MIEGIGQNSAAAAKQIQEAFQQSELSVDPTQKGGPDAPSFGDMLGDLLNQVDQAQKAADTSIQELVTGESTSIQDVVLKMEEADLAFSMMKEVREKLMRAYKEVMSMQA